MNKNKNKENVIGLSACKTPVFLQATQLFEITQDPSWSDPSWKTMEESIPALLKNLTVSSSPSTDEIQGEKYIKVYYLFFYF